MALPRFFRRKKYPHDRRRSAPAITVELLSDAECDFACPSRSVPFALKPCVRANVAGADRRGDTCIYHAAVHESTSSASRGLHFAAELVYTQNETGYTFRVWRERDRGFQCSRPSGNLTLRTIRGKVEVEVNPLPGISRHHDWSRSLLKLMCSEFIPFQMIKDQKLVEKCDSPSKTE